MADQQKGWPLLRSADWAGLMADWIEVGLFLRERKIQNNQLPLPPFITAASSLELWLGADSSAPALEVPFFFFFPGAAHHYC